MRIEALDCSVVTPQPSPEEAQWLSQVARELRAEDHVLSLANSRLEDEPVVFCEWDGKWRTGRYIGSVRYKGGTLVIRPRLGLNTVRKWLANASNLQLLESPGELLTDDSFIAQLVAKVWADALVEAARHGLPALRADHLHTGATVRGRLDVASTVAARARLYGRVHSIRSQKDLDNPIAHTIACAYSVLRRWLGPGKERQWLPPRCQELLPHILAATGAVPSLPSESDLTRIRYTPITQGYRRLVGLSWQIARKRGLFAAGERADRSVGVLLDVAELWELYVLSVLREAAHPLAVRHGTRDPEARGYLLRSEADGSLLAELRPDAIIEQQGRARCILDAKYKFLSEWPGPAREDLYQLGSYVTRYGETGRPFWGALIYPEDPSHPVLPSPERKSPWVLGPAWKISMLTLPHDSTVAIKKMHSAISASVVGQIAFDGRPGY